MIQPIIPHLSPKINRRRRCRACTPYYAGARSFAHSFARLVRIDHHYFARQSGTAVQSTGFLRPPFTRLTPCSAAFTLIIQAHFLCRELPCLLFVSLDQTLHKRHASGVLEGEPRPESCGMDNQGSVSGRPRESGAAACRRIGSGSLPPGQERHIAAGIFDIFYKRGYNDSIR